VLHSHSIGYSGHVRASLSKFARLRRVFFLLDSPFHLSRQRASFCSPFAPLPNTAFLSDFHTFPKLQIPLLELFALLVVGCFPSLPSPLPASLSTRPAPSSVHRHCQSVRTHRRTNSPPSTTTRTNRFVSLLPLLCSSSSGSLPSQTTGTRKTHPPALPPVRGSVLPSSLPTCNASEVLIKTSSDDTRIRLWRTPDITSRLTEQRMGRTGE
jgi:hypothetical protein